MIEIKAPGFYTPFKNLKTIFLAGSIEMGLAEDWQTRVVKELRDYLGIILNPRRDDWDSTWTQSITNPQFKEQVTWEYNGINQADLVFFYFDPKTKSPITLFELGHVLGKKPVVVVCPHGYWRKGNVEIYCYLNNQYIYQNLEAGIFYLKTLLNH